ncbi:MAG: hypothetical protein JO110_17470 [Acetobacteraceae bacterium]|nr:hypothetical protein [Acetobacteraceae bacterium]
MEAVFRSADTDLEIGLPQGWKAPVTFGTAIIRYSTWTLTRIEAVPPLTVVGLWTKAW